MDLSKEYSMHSSSGEAKVLTMKELFARKPRTLLYFYPKDLTPGCTLEAQDFTRLRRDFESLGIQVVGVSLDDMESHYTFATSCGLGIDLISDADKSLHNEFGVIGEKKNYGKAYVGVIRSTFLLDREGNILKEWRNVKATGHAEKLLKTLS